VVGLRDSDDVSFSASKTLGSFYDGHTATMSVRFDTQNGVSYLFDSSRLTISSKTTVFELVPTHFSDWGITRCRPNGT